MVTFLFWIPKMPKNGWTKTYINLWTTIKFGFKINFSWKKPRQNLQGVGGGVSLGGAGGLELIRLFLKKGKYFHFLTNIRYFLVSWFKCTSVPLKSGNGLTRPLECPSLAPPCNRGFISHGSREQRGNWGIKKKLLRTFVDLNSQHMSAAKIAGPPGRTIML